MNAGIHDMSFCNYNGKPTLGDLHLSGLAVINMGSQR
jgi:hypothetical protein